MSETYFSNQKRVRAVLLTQRNTIVLIKRRHPPEIDPEEQVFWIAPGGDVHDDDPDEHTALKRELLDQLGAEVEILEPAMSLFMERWNFYLCRLQHVDVRRRQRSDWRSADGGLFLPQEFALEEDMIRAINVQPRALLDYLLANLEKLRSI